MPTIGIIGTRGIPNRYGGFERFVELLVDDVRWASTDVRFKVYGEGDDACHNSWTDLHSVGFKKDERRFWYYFKSAIMATRDCDIVLCCSVPLSIFSYWPRLFGKPLIMNPDGCEWRRTKWSWLGRIALRAMYVPAISAASKVVLDAEALRSDFGMETDPRVVYIPYAAPVPISPPLQASTRAQFSLRNPYMLIVARLEPENNVQMAIEAFQRCGRSDIDLVVVGGKTTPHFKETLSAFSGANVRFVGGVYDQEALNEIRANCIAYWHGHSVGGTNPSLLEALATVTGAMLCHDNVYNREVAGSEAIFVKDASSLELALTNIFSALPKPTRQATRDGRFHPDTIFNSYYALFQEMAARSDGRRL